MADNFTFPGIIPSNILLPSQNADFRRWAVIACDQFTSQADYWEQVKSYVGDAPSTLHLMQPEAWLSQGDCSQQIQTVMRSYLSQGVLIPRVKSGFVLTERTTASGTRLGLVAALDLEAYDFNDETRLCRATEDTVIDRLPPRIKIRENAILEMPHVMLLIDDAECTVIEPLYDARSNESLLYDTELMLGGGHLRGWALQTSIQKAQLSMALQTLEQKSQGFLYAVGDGNHSLAAAKRCWEAHPDRPELRYALVEIVNIHSSALQFEPIHRIIKNCNPQKAAAQIGLPIPNNGEPVSLPSSISIQDFQKSADAWLHAHPESEIDYIHGENDLRSLCKEENTLGILLYSMDKNTLFPAIRQGGHLPRKTFSMGEAREKRYYMECRLLSNQYEVTK